MALPPLTAITKRKTIPNPALQCPSLPHPSEVHHGPCVGGGNRGAARYFGPPPAVMFIAFPPPRGHFFALKWKLLAAVLLRELKLSIESIPPLAGLLSVLGLLPPLGGM